MCNTAPEGPGGRGARVTVNRNVVNRPRLVSICGQLIPPLRVMRGTRASGCASTALTGLARVLGAWEPRAGRVVPGCPRSRARAARWRKGGGFPRAGPGVGAAYGDPTPLAT